LKRLLSILVIGILIFVGFGAASSINDNAYNLKIERTNFVFSNPIIKDEGKYLSVNLKESATFLLDPGKPLLPVVSQVYTYPFKTKINNVEVIFSEPKTLVLSKEIKPAPEPIILDTELQTTNQLEKNINIYENEAVYPSNAFIYSVGAGLANDEHVIFFRVIKK